MTPEESNLINGLFQRLRTSDTASKDPQALQLIQSQVTAAPGAPYLLVQTVLVQEQALKGAQAQIAQLQAQLAQANQGAAKPQGGFLSGLLHPRAAAPTAPPLPTAAPAQQAPPAYAPTGYAAPQPVAGAGGGGFLQGALSTAAGVAGGALLFQGIESLLGHNSGPFGSVMGGGYGGSGFGGGGGGFGGSPTENVEVVNNNYYDNSNPSFLPQAPQSDDLPEDDALDQNQDPNIDDSQLADADSGDDDSGFDNSGGDGGDGGGGDYA